MSVDAGAPPAGADIIDLSRYSVIPGLIDLHTHLTYYWDRTPGTHTQPTATASRRHGRARRGQRAANARNWCDDREGSWGINEIERIAARLK